MLNHEEICELIPHNGDMCLIDSVISWDETTIKCESKTHLSDSNPLLRHGKLSSVIAIEYAAQSMAIHGGLLANENGESLSSGYLAALRDIEIKLQDMRKLNDNMVITAEQSMAHAGNLIYRFNIYCHCDQLVSGRATVVAV